jgi:hypothetical protein
MGEWAIVAVVFIVVVIVTRGAAETLCGAGANGRRKGEVSAAAARVAAEPRWR